jgi:hypothetical protein
MLRIVNIEEIERLLLQLPALVQQQEQRSINFASSAGAWLSALEKVFTANRLYQAGYIASLRSGLVAAEQGEVPAGLEFRGRLTHSRVLNAVASQALHRAVEVASTLIAENQPRLGEAERIAQQLVAVAFSRELIMARDKRMNDTQYLLSFKSQLVSSPDLENVVTHLEGLVGPYDTLILLDRALAPYQNIVLPSK